MFANFFPDKILKLHSALKSSSILFHRLIFNLKTLLPYSALSLWFLKMKCLKSYLTHLTVSLLLMPFLHLSSNNALLPTLTNIINLSLVSGTFPDQYFKSCSVIPLLKKYNLTKKTFLTIDLSLIFLSYLYLMNVLLRTALLRISLLIISSIHINLSTPSVILLSVLFLPFMTISLSLWVNNTSLLYVSSIFLLPSIILIILFFFITYRLGLVLMAQLFLGLLLIYLLEALSFLSTLLPLQLLHFVKAFHRDQSLDHAYSYCILLLSVLSSLIRLSVIICWWQLFISFRAPEFSANILHLQNTIDLVSQWMSANLLSLNQSKAEFLLIGLPTQLSKISAPSLLMPSNVTISPAQSARNLGVSFDSTLSMSDHISSVSKSCFLSIRNLRRMRNTLDFSTARTIATSLIHSKLDYCNSLFLNLPQSELGRLQLSVNSSARAFCKTPKFASFISSPQIFSLAQNWAAHPI